MNYNGKSNSFCGYDDPQHKPKISLCIDGSERFYQCTDGGLTQYGNSPKEAFNALKSLR